jgi:hypothetical protein
VTLSGFPAFNSPEDRQKWSIPLPATLDFNELNYTAILIYGDNNGMSRGNLDEMGEQYIALFSINIIMWNWNGTAIYSDNFVFCLFLALFRVYWYYLYSLIR